MDAQPNQSIPGVVFCAERNGRREGAAALHHIVGAKDVERFGEIDFQLNRDFAVGKAFSADQRLYVGSLNDGSCIVADAERDFEAETKILLCLSGIAGACRSETERQQE